jgi:GT2 family glycosyltransferase
MRRAVFDAVGPFDARYAHDAFDDYEWSLRLRERGIRTRFVPRAIAWHEHALTLEARIAAVRHAGEAARAHPRGSRETQAFESLLAADPAATAASLARERARSAPGIGASATRWQLELAVAFLEGYRGTTLMPPPSSGSRAPA